MKRKHDEEPEGGQGGGSAIYLTIGSCFSIHYWVLYNNPSYSRILIGSRLWSIRGQMHDWRHHYKIFHLSFKIAESFENLDNILHDWEKHKNKKSIVEASNRYEKHSLAGKRMIKPFSFLENGTEKILQQSAVEQD